MQFWLGRQTEPLQIRKRCPYLQISGLQTFFTEGQKVNILVFAGQKVSVTTPQVCHCHTKEPQTTHQLVSQTLLQVSAAQHQGLVNGTLTKAHPLLIPLTGSPCAKPTQSYRVALL